MTELVKARAVAELTRQLLMAESNMDWFKSTSHLTDAHRDVTLMNFKYRIKRLKKALKKYDQS